MTTGPRDRGERGERGAAAIELALVLPVLFVMLTGVVDIASALHLRAQLQEASQEAAAWAARNPTVPHESRQRAVDAVSAVELAADEVSITCHNSGGTNRVSVEITHEHGTVFLGSDGTLTVRASLVSDVLSDQGCVPS